MPERIKLCYTWREKGIGRLFMEDIMLYGIDYYKKSVFKGSYRGMCFRIARGGEEENPVLCAVAWKGPYILEKTEEKPLTKEFPFSEEGLAAAAEWLAGTQAFLFPCNEREKVYNENDSNTIKD